MKKSNRVALNISNISDDALVMKVQSILSNMDENPNFPPPFPELEALKTTAAAFEHALASQRPGSREDTVRKNNARAILEQAFRLLGTAVEVKSNNDLATMLSSGFETRKNPAPYGRLEKPASLQIELTSRPGSVKLTTAKVAGASSYLFQYALVPVTDEGQWHTVASTARTKVIDDLEPGKQYIFRVAGVGADPTMVVSDAVIRFVA
jgi:hypothetical protein